MQTHTATPTAPQPQPGIDARGNYSNDGDMHRPGELLETLVPRILAHLRSTFQGYDFSPEREVYAGGRAIRMKIISGPSGLTDEAAATAFKSRVHLEMQRFDRSRGNVYSDYHSGSFNSTVDVDARYYAEHAIVVEGTDVASTMSISEFKRTIKAGDRIVLEATNGIYAQKRIGIERTIAQVRSGDFIVGEGKEKSYFDFPKAKAFACDGERFRVSDASPSNPDRYRLYRWMRA